MSSSPKTGALDRQAGILRVALWFSMDWKLANAKLNSILYQPNVISKNRWLLPYPYISISAIDEP